MGAESGSGVPRVGCSDASWGLVVCLLVDGEHSE